MRLLLGLNLTSLRGPTPKSNILSHFLSNSAATDMMMLVIKINNNHDDDDDGGGGAIFPLDGD